MGSPLSIHDVRQISNELSAAPINLNRIEQATKKGRWSYLVHPCHRTQPLLSVLIEKMNQTFIRLEERGVKIFDPKTYHEKERRYRENRQVCSKVVQQIGEYLSELYKDLSKEESSELRKAYHELRLREIGLRYSLGEDQGGIDPLEEPDENHLNMIIEHAKAWKKKQPVAVSEDLNELDKSQLRELARYPEWLAIVYEDPEYLKKTFNWCLRNFNQVEVMVKCCETRRRLENALLSSSLGYVRNICLTEPDEEALAFRTIPTKVNGISKSILAVAIYHGEFNVFNAHEREYVNILDPKTRIHFKRGNYSLTVKEFLEMTAKKNEEEVNINLCADWGFIDFHPVKGMWNADRQCYEMPEMSEDDWIGQVPPSRIASHAELRAQYGDEVENRSFFFKVMATREHMDLTALDCHAWWQLYIRMPDDNWKVLNVGVYAYRFQQGILDGLYLFCATVKRVLCLMDQNNCLTRRQRGAFPVFTNPGEEEELLKRIFRIMNTNGVFQFVGRNCALPVQTISQRCHKDLPDFFHIPITQSRIGVGFLDAILAWAHRQSERIRWWVVTLLHNLLFSFRSLHVQTARGRRDYSVQDYLNKKGHFIYNPAKLPHQIAEARKSGEGPFVKGELYWTYTDEKIFQHQALMAAAEQGLVAAAEQVLMAEQALMAAAEQELVAAAEQVLIVEAEKNE